MCDLWMKTPILETETLPILEKKGFKFGWPCRSRKKDGDPVTRQTNIINKIIQLRDTKYQNGLLIIKQIIATPKLTHSRSN